MADSTMNVLRSTDYVERICEVCSKPYRVQYRYVKAGRGRVCSKACAGIKGGRARIGQQYGANNPNWKGGISKEFYRYKKIQKVRWPERVKARDILRRAVSSGKVTKEPCSVCGDPKSFAHHHDYSKPLDVTWLCRPHHHAIHNGH